ncbi:putative inactive nicotinamidase [Capsicum baccatum]|uniref:Inactive nicotinamidase n=1 Tax=Capsicum baccatum TaxID=33114 RepID=A0A2G2WIW9_CAPBA|nr:putative inactive nicotinamidase [Capsicum baccatum]
MSDVSLLGVQTTNCIRQSVFDAVALEYQRVTVIINTTTAATPDIHIGRKELTSFLNRKKYNEMTMSALEKKHVRLAPLEIRFYLRDLLGSAYLKTAEAPIEQACGMRESSEIIFEAISKAVRTRHLFSNAIVGKGDDKVC